MFVGTVLLYDAPPYVVKRKRKRRLGHKLDRLPVLRRERLVVGHQLAEAVVLGRYHEDAHHVAQVTKRRRQREHQS